jgi:UDP-glucuronate 4-epimerase
MSGELMAYSYVDQYDISITALRFFTVYGPWGRPDMAVFKFTAAILAGQPVDLYAGGVLRRDFTFVEDTVQGVLGAIDHPPRGEAERFRAYNLGRGEPATVLDLLDELEAALGKRAIRRNLPPQLGDVNVTYADIVAAQRDLSYRPQTSLRDGIAQFVAWYREYYHISQSVIRQSA